MAYPQKFIMRSCAPLDENFTPMEVIKHNHFWNNMGNYLFVYSVNRLLSVEGASITPYKAMSEKDAEYINQNYDCFLMPLANAFRDSFIENLKSMTRLVKALTIPVVIIGVGFQGKVNPDADASYPFDDAAREFCTEVLKHSKSIGVRGNLTKQYLLHLGFADEQIDVIGCPSMYMYGRDVSVRKKPSLDKDALITLNGHSGLPKRLYDIWDKVESNFENYYFIPQENGEFTYLYALDSGEKKIPQRMKEVYHSGHARMFTTAPAWFDFMKQVDFSVGNRIHGNIAAAVNGAPALVFATDARIQELAEFHGIPYMLESEYDESMTVADLYERADYSHFSEINARNFDNFLAFLEKNHLDHIFNHDGISTYDKVLDSITFEPPVEPFLSVSKEEQAKRLSLYMGYKNSVIADKQSKLVKTKSTLKQAQTEIKALKNQNKQNDDEMLSLKSHSYEMKNDSDKLLKEIKKLQKENQKQKKLLSSFLVKIAVKITKLFKRG